MRRRAIVVASILPLTSFVVPADAADTRAQSGIAATYSYHSRTASGEVARPGALTAAHRTLPFGTMVRVTNKRNGSTVVVRINDRGPWTGSRIIDLSKAAAAAIDLLQAGEAPVLLIGL